MDTYSEMMVAKLQGKTHIEVSIEEASEIASAIPEEKRRGPFGFEDRTRSITARQPRGVGGLHMDALSRRLAGWP